jgi:uncharacterized Zn-finger protein
VDKRRCLRCGGTDLIPGVIYDFMEYGKRGLTFEWTPDHVWNPSSVPLNAILCKSCGHTEFIANLDIFIPTTQRECPHCKRIYAYREDDEISPKTVKCPYCHNVFKIDPPIKCPLCGAVYLYSPEKIKEGTAICQNCGKLFLTSDAEESDILMDALEEDLERRR